MGKVSYEHRVWQSISLCAQSSVVCVCVCVCVCVSVSVCPHVSGRSSVLVCFIVCFKEWVKIPATILLLTIFLTSQRNYAVVIAEFVISLEEYVASTNNIPKVIAGYYKDCVLSLGGNITSQLVFTHFYIYILSQAVQPSSAQREELKTFM